MVSSCSVGLNINEFELKTLAQILSINLDEIFQVAIANDTEKAIADKRMTDRSSNHIKKD